MKDIADMTIDELNALPEYRMFGADVYPVQTDGTVTLPDGRVLRGLVGKLLNVPRREEVATVYWASDQAPIFWRDAAGVYWRPVKLVTGEWRKECG